MSALNVGQQIHDFRVDAFLKSMYGYEQTYLATSVQEEHKKVLLKLYDVMEFPSRQLSEGGTLMEGNIRNEMYHWFAPIHLYDTVLLDGKEYHCLVREYIESKRLSDLLAEGKRYSWDEAMPIIHQVLNGLSCLHRQERAIIHNDMTPRNILLYESREHETKVYIIGTGHLSYRRSGVPYR
jgi:transitional endoplasmic reticulum ATPase